jgi:hypothetical protein
VDIFDRDAVRSVLERAKPSVVIDTMTSLPKSPAELGNAQAADRKLRLEGGGNLFAAAKKNPVWENVCFRAQSRR